MTSGATDVWGRFAQSFAVRADEPARAHALLGHRVQAALMSALNHTVEVPTDPRVALGDEGLRIRTSPTGAAELPFGDDGYVAYLAEEAGKVAEQVIESAQHLPAAASLAGLGDELARIALETGLTFSSAPLALEGRRLGVECRAIARRSTALSYDLVVEARFVEPLGLGLAIGHPPELPRWLDAFEYGSKRFTTGDAAFDSTLELCVSNIARAKAVVSDVARWQLLKLRGFGPFTGDDRGLELRLRAPVVTGEIVLSALGAISDAAAVLSGVSLERVGPYR